MSDPTPSIGDIRNVGSDPTKDPEDWVTGDEPMTGPQRSYLETLSREAGEEPDPTLTKAQASMRIDELQRLTGRGSQDQAARDESSSAPGSPATGRPDQ